MIRIAIVSYVLQICGLENRIVKDAVNFIEDKINYDSVYKKIAEERDR